MVALTEDLHRALFDKVIGLHAVLIEDKDAPLFVDSCQALIGPAVHADLSVSAEEFNLAGKCLALGQSTAAVAHAMRAVEASLHSLCNVLGISFPNSVAELQDWIVLTEKITAEVDKWKKTRRGPMKDEHLTKLAELMIPADGFRLAWRNSVAHARVKYEEPEAREILADVGKFLRRLSAAIS